MKDHFIPGMIAGIFLGVAVFMAISLATNTAPTQIEMGIHKEAVSRGYGKWVIDTNTFNNGTPTTHFEWNK